MMEERKLSAIAQMQKKEIIQRVSEIKILRSKVSRVRILQYKRRRRGKFWFNKQRYVKEKICIFM